MPRIKIPQSKVPGLRDIHAVCNSFPALHAYGIGLKGFRKLPEEQRANTFFRAREMLMNEMRPEVEACMTFLTWVCKPRSDRYGTPERLWFKASYFCHMYKYYQITNSDAPDITLGAMLVGALLNGKQIKVHYLLSPNGAIRTWRRSVGAVEKFLRFNTDFRPFPVDTSAFDSIYSEIEERNSKGDVELTKDGVDLSPSPSEEAKEEAQLIDGAIEAFNLDPNDF